ncbi:MAG: hypothetical protein ACNS62_10345 [Candidatus Cyclobacteriaceae bacterium M3_2C_046]
MDYLKLAQLLGAETKSILISDLKNHSKSGIRQDDPNDVKSVHQIDRITGQRIRELLGSYPCNLYMESFPPLLKDSAEFTVFIDPVDGSINWDRGIADPCLAIAISDKVNHLHFHDLSFAYIEGFISGDFYFTHEKESYYYNQLTDTTRVIKCNKHIKLADSLGLLKTGYGQAEKQLKKTYSLFLKCKDIRAFDNTNLEICLLSRNAADFMVDVRGLSDFYNLLAFPILKYAEGSIYDLEGKNLENQLIKPDQNYDYLACVNAGLFREVWDLLT